MTRPGPRGRHAAPDDDARPDEATAAGRHAAPEPLRRRHAAADDGVSEPPPRRHAAPDEPANGVAYHRPLLGNNIRLHRPAPYTAPQPARPGPDPRTRNGAGYGPEPSPNGYAPTAGPGYGELGESGGGSGSHRAEPDPNGTDSGREPGANGYAGGANGLARRRAEWSPDDHPAPAADPAGYRPPNGADGRGYDEPDRADRAGYRLPNGADGIGYHRPNGAAPSGYRSPNGVHAAGYRSPNRVDPTGYPQPGGADPSGYRSPNSADPTGYRLPDGADPSDYRLPNGAYPAGYHRPDGADPGGYHRSNGAAPSGYHRPNGGGHRRAEPDAADPGTNGVAYHRPAPGAHRYGEPEPAPHPWPGTNGYHLDGPAPPAVNGYRLDEPVAPVTGFPYSAPPATPTAYPVNGHGVDAAERDAASWPVNGTATAWPVDGQPTELDRPPDPQIAVVPLHEEPTEVLDRPEPKPAAGKPAEPPHPPRAVVRRRRARRKALEWPFLIVFAIVSAFLIRQYVVQTFYIPSASMHETLIEGDRVLVNKVGYHLHDIHRGDVIVFRKPPNLNVSEDDLIKRVVALPGETVEGRGGKVYVNGAPLDEPYVEPLCHGTGEFAKVTVPAGRLWMMGDNRCNSSDSRVFGPIDENLVVGRAFVIAWPFDRLSWL